MATYTLLGVDEARELGRHFGLDVIRIEPIARGSVNSNYAADVASGRRVFIRIYEEQNRAGAEAEARLLDHLARNGVPTPCPLARLDGRGFTIELTRPERPRPVIFFPWQAGEMICQKLVTPRRTHAIGAMLARVHRSGEDYGEKRIGRYEVGNLRERLEAIAHAPSSELRTMAARITERLDALVASHDVGSGPRGVIHGDLFRDNVLWEEERVAALLDFESACDGSFAYDLMVTALAWCYGDKLELDLVRSLFAGYQSVRRLEAREREALHPEGKLAALRFTVTRITDFAMRAEQGANLPKDWRRFWRRHAELEAIGASNLTKLLD